MMNQIFCDVNESPWNSEYIIFILPGLILWIIGAIWSIRKNNLSGSIALQVIGAFEVLVGSIFGMIFAMSSLAEYIHKGGVIDSSGLFSDFYFSSKSVFFALQIHVILLALTTFLIFVIKRINMKAQQAAT